MSDAGFPSQTADTLVVAYTPRPAGELSVGNLTVWIQTLNELQRERAEEAAQYEAQKAIRKYRKNTEDYKLMFEDLLTAELDDITTMIVEHQIVSGAWYAAAFDKYPDKPKPEQGNVSPAEYSDMCAVVETYNAGLIGKRNKYVEDESKKYEKAVRGWTPNTRAAKAAEILINTTYVREFSRHMMLQVILRASRMPDDHTKLYFSSVDVIEDLDDAIRNGILAKYNELDTVKPSEIPT